ncbi:glycerate kinase, partial [Vibrio cholerae]
LAALGARFTNADGDPIQLTGGGLRELTHIDLQDVDPRLQH